jgi:hypothetical protein
MPIIAGRASAAYGAGFGKAPSGSSFTPVGAYQSIATFTLAGNTSSITFDAIPQNYNHLELRCYMRGGTGEATGFGETAWTFNDEYPVRPSYTYNKHTLGGGSSALAASSITNTDPMYGPDYPRGGSFPNYYGVQIALIEDYSILTKKKTLKVIGGFDATDGSSGKVSMWSGMYNSTDGVRSITIFPNQANYGASSHFALYGIR